jgi:dTDP-4-amino-4,6-dideoxygalactose transaminase
VPGLTLPTISQGCKHVFHLYPVQIDPVEYGMTKDDFVHAMFYQRGVKVGTHYTPLHYATAFQRRGFKRGQFPVAEAVSDRLVTLPINPRQTREALDYLIESIRALHRR